MSDRSSEHSFILHWPIEDILRQNFSFVCCCIVYSKYSSNVHPLDQTHGEHSASGHTSRPHTCPPHLCNERRSSVRGALETGCSVPCFLPCKIPWEGLCMWMPWTWKGLEPGRAWFTETGFGVFCCRRIGIMTAFYSMWFRESF